MYSRLFFEVRGGCAQAKTTTRCSFYTTRCSIEYSKKVEKGRSNKAKAIIYFFTSLHPFLVSICSSIHSCVHEWMHAYLTFIHSFIRSFIHSFIHSFTHSILTPSFAGSLTHTLIRSFIHLIDHSVSLESVSQSATRVFHHTLWRRKNLFKIEISFVNSYCNSRYFLSCYDEVFVL